MGGKHGSLEELRLENTQQGGENHNPGIAPVVGDHTAPEEHHIVLGEVGRRTGHEALGIPPVEDRHIGAVGLQGQRIAVLEDQGRGMLAQSGHMAHSGYTKGWVVASYVHRIG